MQLLMIEGGRPLHGNVQISGAKNASLPILAATLLAPGQHRIENLPALRDVSTMLSLLGRVGCASLAGSMQTRVDTRRIAFSEAPRDLVARMRASILILGPLLARTGRCTVALPGGCAIGSRPVEQHLRGLEALGAQFSVQDGCIVGTTDGLKGATIQLAVPTVTGTENILMAATLAEGTTRIRNAAREPEIVDLARFLRTLGADIEGEGTSCITVQGASSLSPAEAPYSVMFDRIEAGTYLCAAAVTGGDVTVEGVQPEVLRSTLEVLAAAGCSTITNGDRVRCVHPGRALGPIDFATAPHPGVPTDMQAQLCVVACMASGESRVHETVFENRFMHLPELTRMGAMVQVDGSRATVHGGRALHGATVMGTDLRATAALVLAGLAAQGRTEVGNLHHLDRGYEGVEHKLGSLGASLGRCTVQPRREAPSEPLVSVAAK